MDGFEPVVELGTTLQPISATFFLDADSYAEARDRLIAFLASAPVEYALECGLRHMVVARDARDDPAAVHFCEN